MRSAFRDLNGSDFKPDSASLHCVDAGCGAHIVLRATDSTKLKNISGGAPIYFLTSDVLIGRLEIARIIF